MFRRQWTLGLCVCLSVSLIGWSAPVSLSIRQTWRLQSIQDRVTAAPFGLPNGRGVWKAASSLPWDFSGLSFLFCYSHELVCFEGFPYYASSNLTSQGASECVILDRENLAAISRESDDDITGSWVTRPTFILV